MKENLKKTVPILGFVVSTTLFGLSTDYELGWLTGFSFGVFCIAFLAMLKTNIIDDL